MRLQIALLVISSTFSVLPCIEDDRILIEQMILLSTTGKTSTGMLWHLSPWKLPVDEDRNNTITKT